MSEYIKLLSAKVFGELRQRLEDLDKLEADMAERMSDDQFLAANMEAKTTRSALCEVREMFPDASELDEIREDIVVNPLSGTASRLTTKHVLPLLKDISDDLGSLWDNIEVSVQSRYSTDGMVACGMPSRLIARLRENIGKVTEDTKELQ